MNPNKDGATGRLLGLNFDVGLFSRPSIVVIIYTSVQKHTGEGGGVKTWRTLSKKSKNDDPLNS